MKDLRSEHFYCQADNIDCKIVKDTMLGFWKLLRDSGIGNALL
jgi:hypothetical protein